METYYNDVINSVVAYVKKSSDEYLKSDNTVDELVNKFKIESPRFNKEAISIELGSEIMSFSNAPTGVSFTPGNSMDYVLFTVPITGNMSLLSVAFKNIFENSPRTIFEGNRSVVFKEYSPITLVGNETAIENVKKSAKMKITSLDSALDGLGENISIFNETTLRSVIQESIQEEIERRQNTTDTISSLKLF